MATFVHLAPESALSAIRRNGISTARFTLGTDRVKGVFCFPVQPDFFFTHQWLRELRRRSREKLCGVYFRLPDLEPLRVGHYLGPHEIMTAAEAAKRLRADFRLGMEAIVLRRVGRDEIVRIKHLPQLIGWRLFPEAKGMRPLWPAAGSFGAAKIRTKMSEAERRAEARYYSRFPPEWYKDED